MPPPPAENTPTPDAKLHGIELLRWLELPPAMITTKGVDYSQFIVATGVSFGTDKFDNPIVLFPNDWTMRYFVEKNPELKLRDLPPEQA